MTDLDRYHEQLKDHFLEFVEETPRIRAYYLRKNPGSHPMSAFLIFTPEGTVITGDLRPKDGGVIALGYGFDWFIGDHSPRYLAEKFLKQEWSQEAFETHLKETIKEMAQNRGDYDFTPRTWRMGTHAATWPDKMSQAKALRHWLRNYSDEFSTPHTTYESLPAYKTDSGRWHCPWDSEFLSPGYDYDPVALGWLVAIHKKFRELYLRTIL